MINNNAAAESSSLSCAVAWPQKRKWMFILEPITYTKYIICDAYQVRLSDWEPVCPRSYGYLTKQPVPCAWYHIGQNIYNVTKTGALEQQLSTPAIRPCGSVQPCVRTITVIYFPGDRVSHCFELRIMWPEAPLYYYICREVVHQTQIYKSLSRRFLVFLCIFIIHS